MTKFNLRMPGLILGTVLVLATGVNGLDAPPGKESLAVMDLRSAAGVRAEMQTVVDLLSSAYKRSQRFGRVVDRQEREQLLGRSPVLAAEKAYDRTALRDAAQLGVDLLVTGSLTKKKGGFELTLRLGRAGSGEILKETERRFASPESMEAVSEEIALDLIDWQGWSKPRRDVRDKSPRPRSRHAVPRIGIALGHEAVSSGAGVTGGSYLYPECSFWFNQNFGFAAKYSFSVFTPGGTHHRAGFSARWNFPLYLKDRVWASLKPGYGVAFDAGKPPRHFAGVTFVPVFSGDDDVLIEVLPVSVYFNLATGKPLYTLELISVGVTFGVSR